MSVNRKVFKTDSGDTCFVLDDNNGISLKSGNNNVIVGNDATSIANPYLETIATKKVMMQETGLLGFIPFMPSMVPSIPFAKMLPTLAIVGAAAASMAALNVAKSSKNNAS